MHPGFCSCMDQQHAAPCHDSMVPCAWAGLWMQAVPREVCGAQLVHAVLFAHPLQELAPVRCPLFCFSSTLLGDKEQTTGNNASQEPHASSHSTRAGIRVLQKHPVLEVAASWTGMGEHPSCWGPGSNHGNKERSVAYPTWISSSLGEVLEQGPGHSWFCPLMFRRRLRKC